MFGSLFETENEGANALDAETNLRSRLGKLQCPPEPRGKTRICGLQNQGATCYLNSLLQTLFFTPEFRNGIFQLGPGDLKYQQSSDARLKVRVILVELQKLFAKLLLLDQDSINTTDLTDSFGWKGKQSFEQHDVQELNRILFNAVESSLVGTSCQGLIRKLYRGTLITKVICKECGFTSEREEDYLDLPLILSGCSSLEQSLSMSYIVKESLEGTNQYKCSSCRRHVDASKGSKIKKLPPILTFSLLRFDYDFRRGERFKDTKRFSFPSELNMSEFCEAHNELQNQQYELFSVVIHSGSCYGGHYHVYICDVEGLGLWHEPDKEPVKIVHEDEKGRENFVNCDHPVDLLSTLLRKLGGTASVNQLCQHMSKQAGISWNKRYKSQYGPLTKFLKTNSDIFSFDDSCGGVSLKFDGGEISEKLSSSERQMQDESFSIKNGFPKSGIETSATVHEEKQPLLKRSAVVPAEFGHCWFDVNDARISSIRERDIQNQFAGKESAYMLFYRKKCLVVSRNDPLSSVSAGLREEVERMNCRLKKQREEYELCLNQIHVNIHFGKHFTVADGILQMKEGTCSEPRVVPIDRRKSAADLVETLRKLYAFADKEASNLTVHIARYLPAGLHLFQDVTKHPEMSLVQSGVCDGTDLFLWNGKEIDGYRVLPGDETVPVLLTLMNALSQDEKAVEIQKSFRKDTTVGQIKLMLCNSFRIDRQNLLLRSVKIRGKTSDSVHLIADLDGQTLNEIGIQDGDRLIAEKSGEIPPSTQSTAKVTSTKNEEHSSFMTFVVENRCLKTKADIDGNSCNSWPLFTVKVKKEETIGQLKTKVLQMQNDNQESKDIQCRFRVDDDFEGLGPPVYDHSIISESWLKKGQKFVLEPGAPLLPSEIMIRYYVRSPNHSRVEMEQTVHKDITISQCLELLISKAGLQEGKWHLRKTNWMSEPAESLDKEDSTLEKENIKNGDVVIVEEGRIPPKGFICLSLWQTRGRKEIKLGNSGYDLSHQTSTDLQVENPRKEHDTAEIAQCFEAVGNVEISQDATLFNLKLQISALPQFSDHMIPTPGFVRLRVIEDGQLTRVLRGTNRTLSQLKLRSSTHLFIRILKQEEDLSASAVLLRIKRRIPGKRLYSADEEEVIFEPTEGATPNSLRQFVSGVCNIPLDRLNIAKYFRQKYDWLVISDSFSRQGKKGGKKKVNLRQSPFHLQDGDIIGVRDCGHIEGDNNKDDFSTLDDDIAKKQLQQVEEERKQRKRERRTRRPEVPLIIHVDEFR